MNKYFRDLNLGDLYGNTRIPIYVFLMLLLLVSVNLVIVNHSQNKIVELKAREIGNVVASQATAARSIYNSTIVAKLNNDGIADIGTSHDSLGAVPLPAQFLEALAKYSSADSGTQYEFRSISKWNINPEQGLTDDFQKWAWSQLEQQEQGVVSGEAAWRPVWRVEDVDEVKKLRYLSPDSAISQTCVDCHNGLEQMQKIKSQRYQAGVPAGKTWELNGLIGAVEVTMPIDKSTDPAATYTKNGFMLMLFVTLLCILLMLIMSIIDRSRSRKHTRHLEHQTRNDPLTNLPNRAGFHYFANKLLNVHRDDYVKHAVMILDLNDFKRINDTLGHEIGDRVLVKIAHNLRSCVPGNSIVSRLGGDEFAVFLPNTNIDLASEIAKDIDRTLDMVVKVDEYRMHAPVSTGVALYPEHGRELEELLRCADVAMYCAKRNKCCYAFYDAAYDNNHLSTLSIISDFKSALHESSLSLAYQPKFNLISGRILGMEALLRWDHPEFGMIPPSYVIPLAEQTGQISKLTQWTLQSGLAQLKHWLRSGYDINLSFNLSAEMLNSDSAVDMILECLRESGTPAQRVTIEVTETAMMKNKEKAVEQLTRLRANDVIVSLDDFGTGYSSLAVVHELPLDELKLDRSFLVGENRERVKAMIKTAKELASNLDLELVAEGVEDFETLALLYEIKCDTVQGFFLCEPISADEFEEQFSLLEQYAGECVYNLQSRSSEKDNVSSVSTNSVPIASLDPEVSL